jgi:cystathionine beta-synthase
MVRAPGVGDQPQARNFIKWDVAHHDNSMTYVLDLIGNTPLIEARRLDTGKSSLFLKLENQNPGGSIKDRIALSMIEAAEKSKSIAKGGLLVEATAGNTGLGLALVASQKGYRLLIVVPDKMSQEKIFHLRALGAEVVMTRSDVTKGHPEYYQDKAARIAKERGAFYVNQFGNEANPLAHEQSTGPEIWKQMDGKIDAMVCGVGTGGTKSSPMPSTTQLPTGGAFPVLIRGVRIEPSGSASTISASGATRAK